MARINAAALRDAMAWCFPSLSPKAVLHRDGGMKTFALAIRQDVADAQVTIGATNGQTLATYAGVPVTHLVALPRPILLGYDQARALAAVLRTVPDQTVEVRVPAGATNVCVVGAGWHLSGVNAGAEFPEAAWGMLAGLELPSYGAFAGRAFAEAFKKAAKAAKSKGLITIRLTGEGAELTAADARSPSPLKVKGSRRGPNTEVRLPAANLSRWASAGRASAWVGIAASDPYHPSLFIASDCKGGDLVIGGQKPAEKKKRELKRAVEAVKRAAGVGDDIEEGVAEQAA